MFKNLSGKRFGKLIVVERVGKDKYRNVKWLCLCDCGNSSEVISSSLKLGRSKSCGCLQVEASRSTLCPGERFGRLKVTAFSRILKERSMYLCECDCGEKVEVQLHRLKTGYTSSCGCNRKTHGLSRTPEYARLHTNKRRARKLAAEGSHTPDEVGELLTAQEGRCFYCNCLLKKYHVEHMVPLCRGGSDSIDNICISCPDCNHKKSIKTADEFLKLMSNKQGGN